MKFLAKAGEQRWLAFLSLMAIVGGVVAGLTVSKTVDPFLATSPNPLALVYLSVILIVILSLLVLGAVAGAMRTRHPLLLASLIVALSVGALIVAAVMLPLSLTFLPRIGCVEVLLLMGLAGAIKISVD